MLIRTKPCKHFGGPLMTVVGNIVKTTALVVAPIPGVGPSAAGALKIYGEIFTGEIDLVELDKAAEKEMRSLGIEFEEDDKEF